MAFWLFAGFMVERDLLLLAEYLDRRTWRFVGDRSGYGLSPTWFEC